MSRARLLALLLAAVALLAGASLAVGAATLDGGEGWRLLAISRLPRTLAVILAGGATAVAGVVMQLVIRNRFVEPATTGTGEAAALGLMAAALLAPGAPPLLKAGLGAGAALLGTGAFLLMAARLPRRDPLLVPLVGLIWGGALGALATWLAWRADLVQLLGTLMQGEFSGVLRGRYELLWLAGAATLACWLAAGRLTVAAMGRGAATGLGLNWEATAALGVLAVSVTTAVTVSTVGLLPFVGLVVPNVVSRLMGDDLRAALPVTAAGGAALVLAADVTGRLVRYPYEIPAGVVAGVLGAALFLHLLWRPARRAHG